MNKIGALILVFLVMSILGLFQIKYRVQYLGKDVEELTRQLDHEKSTIHILKAEWAFLNQPARLKELSRRYLNLEEAKTSQIKDVKNFNSENNHVNNDSNNIITIKNKSNKRIKWRYKAKELSIVHPGGSKPYITISGD